MTRLLPQRPCRIWPCCVGLLGVMSLANLVCQLGAAELASVLEKTGTIKHPPVAEASGLVASRRHPGVLWTICDSGNVAHLFAIDRTGKLLAEYRPDGAVNVDWESVALDDRGNLYIADVGNNLPLPLRWVCQVREPDPQQAVTRGNAARAVQTIPVERTLYYRFPAEPFDVEGTFVLQGSLYLVSKAPRHTALYRLRLGESTEIQTVAKVCDVPAIATVTGADISPDGCRVALNSYREVVIFKLGRTGVMALAGEPACRIPFRAPAVEGCAWDGDDLLLVSEDRSLYRVNPLAHKN